MHGSRRAPVRDATRTLADWLQEWTLTYLELSDRAESTKIMHAGYCRTWIIPTIGQVPLGSLVIGQSELPVGGQQKCPLVATKTAHSWPTDLPTRDSVASAMKRSYSGQVIAVTPFPARA